MSRLQYVALLLSLLTFISSELRAQEVGQTLPRWQEGVLDIHHISTGRGNATFAILPDGTTLLIDAGAVSPIDWQTNKPRNLPLRPGATRQAGEWIARYIRRCLAFRSQPSIDYAVLTHFHDDHMGSPKLALFRKTGNYALTGITEVAEYIPIRKLLDRGWPEYAYPRSLANDSMVINYRQFLTWQMREKALQVERFQAGRTDQIRLVNRPAAYEATFAIRNVIVNGELWTGNGQSTRPLFPALTTVSPAQYPTENMCSAGLHIRYGGFDYFLGGDLTGVLRFGSPPWHDVETPVAAVMGPVDVHLLDHHGYEDSQNESLLAALRPRVLIIPAWHTTHPARSVLERVFSKEIYPGERDVFAIGLLEPTRLALGKLAAQLKSTNGHIMLRVKPGGKSYTVFILDDNDETQRIVAIHGPYLAQ